MTQIRNPKTRAESPRLSWLCNLCNLWITASPASVGHTPDSDGRGASLLPAEGLHPVEHAREPVVGADRVQVRVALQGGQVVVPVIGGPVEALDRPPQVVFLHPRL